MHDNEGTSRLINSIRNQSAKVHDVNNRNNVLGTVKRNGVYIDSIEDMIPKSDFLFLQFEIEGTEENKSCKVPDLKNGDRVLCVPVGDYFVILGKVA